MFDLKLSRRQFLKRTAGGILIAAAPELITGAPAVVTSTGKYLSNTPGMPTPGATNILSEYFPFLGLTASVNDNHELVAITDTGEVITRAFKGNFDNEVISIATSLAKPQRAWRGSVAVGPNKTQIFGNRGSVVLPPGFSR